jgi:hypothetical protein
MDQQLREGPFRDSMNIYAAEMVLTDGDNLSIEDLTSVLLLAGYQDSTSRGPGTFHVSARLLELVAPDGSIQPRARISFSDKPQIARTEVNGRHVRTWAAGYPLMANLSRGREKRHLGTFGEIPQTLVHAVVSAEDNIFFSTEESIYFEL